MTGPPRLSADLREATLRWIADDPSPADRLELQGVLAAALGGSSADLADLAQRMTAPLTFGTAGLRGPLRAGPAGMNLAVIRRAAAGIATYLTAGNGSGGTVVVGYDARHRSAELARDASRVLASAGFRVLLAPSALPTPITAFAVRRLDAVAGLQVTASHNPPQDNGLKVYLRGGTQLVGPADTEIEAAITAAGPAVSIDTSGRPSAWPDDLIEAYIERAAAQGDSTNHLRVAVTPLHGVGGRILVEALHLAGFTDVHVVESQAVPDPDFPTVPFPNPEEPGACDQLLDLARRVHADLAIATDPDADRCAIGIPGRDGTWRMLTGDEAGGLLGDAVLTGLDRTEHPDPLVATTIVSSQLLGRIAASHGVRYDETLTGFKWIVRAGDGRGTGLVFGYEEALGLAVDPEAVRDKDGISAAVLTCRIAADNKVLGRGLDDVLDGLARRHGLHTTGAVSFRVEDLSPIDEWMARLRRHLPTTLIDEPVTEATDLLPWTDGIRLATRRARVVVRPSGTEPKLKCYLELRIFVPAEITDLSQVRREAAHTMELLRDEITELIRG